MGAGAVGAFVGFQLDRHGVEVVLIARGGHLRAMQENGLRVRTDAGEWRRPVRAAGHIAEAGRADLVLVLAKAYDLPGIAADLASALPADALVVNLANGVGTPEILTSVLGPERVLGGIANIKSYLLEPGTIQQVGARAGLQIGELTRTGVTDRVQRVCKLLTDGGVPTVACDDLWFDLWNKAVFHAPVGGLTTLLNQPFGPVRSAPETRALLLAWMEEVAAVARGLGVRLAPDRPAAGLAFVDSVAPDWRNSMQYDRQRGKRLEADAVVGAISRFGRRCGVPTPITDAVYPCLQFLDRLAAEER